METIIVLKKNWQPFMHSPWVEEYGLHLQEEAGESLKKETDKNHF